MLTRPFSCWYYAVLPAIFRKPKYLTTLPNTATISSPKEVLYNLWFCFSVVVLGKSLTIYTYIK